MKISRYVLFVGLMIGSGSMQAGSCDDFKELIEFLKKLPSKGFKKVFGSCDIVQVSSSDVHSFSENVKIWIANAKVS